MHHVCITCYLFDDRKGRRADRQADRDRFRGRATDRETCRDVDRPGGREEKECEEKEKDE